MPPKKPYRWGYIPPGSSPRLTPKSDFLRKLERQQRAVAPAPIAQQQELEFWYEPPRKLRLVRS